MNNSEFFNFLDYIYIALVFISTIAGFIRGFVKDFFSTCAWLGSGFISIPIAPYLISTINKYITNITLARCAAISLSYLAALIILLLTISLVSQKVKNSVLSEIDRAVGVLFGLFRGMGILVCIHILMLTFEVPKDKYSMVKNSKLSIVLSNIAETWMPKITDLSTIKCFKESVSAMIKEKIIKPEIKKEKIKKDKSVFFKSIKNFVAETFARQQEEIDTVKVPPRQITNKPRYKSMSLLEAHVKRRARRKIEKLKKKYENALTEKIYNDSL